MTAGVISVPEWEQFRWLRAGFSARAGGMTSIYGGDGEQNLGWTPEDDANTVAANRLRLIGAVAEDAAMELVTARQVHGAIVQVVRRAGLPLSTPDGKALLQGDGLVTGEPNLLLGMQTADCVPVLIADTRTRAIGAVHAGWRGTVARVAGAAIQTMASAFGSKPEDLVAAIGPSIGPCCFGVGEDVRSAFRQAFLDTTSLLAAGPHGKPHIDLWEANRLQLLAAGLLPQAITVIGECTACTRDRNGRRKYFSHRAEQGITGRMLNVIGVVPEPSA